MISSLECPPENNANNTASPEVAFATDQGPRETLEDAGRCLVLTEHTPGGPVTVIAGVFDGVGGNQGGEVASAIAAQAVANDLARYILGRSNLESDGCWMPRALERASRRAQQAILAAAIGPEREAMATTAVGIVVRDECLGIAWAGDSRCYVAGRSGLQLLTRDHTVANGLVDEGIDPDLARSFPDAAFITRCLGGPCSEPEIITFTIEPGDVIVLVTDGVWGAIGDQRLAELAGAVRSGSSPLVGLADDLVRAAVRAGTDDNATALCIRCADRAPSGSSGPSGRAPD